MSFDFEPCIGVLGGGQLGRMFAREARRMGYQVVQWTGGDTSGAARFADTIISEPFDDADALNRFVEMADVATVEFENIPKELMEAIAGRVPLFPGADPVAIVQDRELEKNFLSEHGIPTTPFKVVESSEELANALKEISGDVIIKTVRFGYDGKGQLAVPAGDQRPSAEEIWKQFEGARVIVEKKINLAAEISVMVVRGQDGQTVAYDPAENIHKHHILHLSIVPARLSDGLLEQAKEIAIKVADSLEYVGVLGVEFFLNEHDELMVNEMACRPHNSGHHTLDACETSQYEQQLRAVCGLPLGSTTLMKPVVMWNLLGDLWKTSTEQPNWNLVHSTAGAKLHLYGKSLAKAKRKMGHVTFVADTIEAALEKAESCVKAFSEQITD